jgi:hypothetical protein
MALADDLGYYAEPGILTRIDRDTAATVRSSHLSAVELCTVAQGLIVLQSDAFGSGLSDARMAERNTRPVSTLLRRALELNEAPFDRPRPLSDRVVGSCRHFAVVATALLRASGIPARARAGFAAYFKHGKWLDHWVCEYWADDARRWIRIDAEVLGQDVVISAEDLPVGQFLSGGESWLASRAGREDPMRFGVDGTANWGPGEIRANALRDLAALNKVEMLPWDEWGPIGRQYEGELGDPFDREIDAVAEATVRGELAAVRDAYRRYAVPASMIA